MNSSFSGSPFPPYLPALSRRALIKTACAAGLAGSVAFARPGAGRRTAEAAARVGVGVGVGRSLVLAADQASERVLLLDAENPSWQHVTPHVREMQAVRAAAWSWSPLDYAGLAVLDPKSSWRMVSEARYRLWDGESWVLTCASGGLAAMVSYPGGWVWWAGFTGGNAHSVEVLPNGNVAVAASTEGFVRIYTASQSPLSGVT